MYFCVVADATSPIRQAKQPSDQEIFIIITNSVGRIIAYQNMAIAIVQEMLAKGTYEGTPNASDSIGKTQDKNIGQRENRWMQDVNHQVSKARVESNPKHTLFVLEDLSGVRNATERVRTKDRYGSVSWSFYDLEQKLIYKAKQNQSAVMMLTLVIRVRVALYVDTLKKLTVTKRTICLLVKTVAINQTMTALALGICIAWE